MDSMKPQRKPPTTQPPPTSGLPGESQAKDALSLVEFPIALITSRALPDDETTIIFTDKDKTLTIVGPRRPAQEIKPTEDFYGLPAPADDEVILALIQLTKRIGFKTVEENAGLIHFSLAEVLRILRWTDTGPNRTRLRNSLLRWKHVSFTYKNSWWDNRERKWTTTRSFSLINDLELSDVHHAGGSQGLLDFARSKFRWSDVIVQSFADGSLRDLDLDCYFRLQRPLARRMYRLLDKEFYCVSEKKYDLKTFFFERIGVRREYHTGELKRIAEKAIEELEREQIIKPDAQRFQKVRRGEWSVRFAAGSSIAGRPKDPAAATRTSDQAAAQESPALQPTEGRVADTDKSVSEQTKVQLTAGLVARGVNAKTAENLIATFPSERIERCLQVFDWLKENNDPKLSKNPPGYLVQSIRLDYQAPEGFEKHQQQKQQQQKTREKRSQQKLKDETRREAEKQEALRERDRREHIDRYLTGLSLEQRSQLEERAFKGGEESLKKAAKEPGRTGEIAKRLLVDREVLRIHPLPAEKADS